MSVPFVTHRKSEALRTGGRRRAITLLGVLLLGVASLALAACEEQRSSVEEAMEEIQDEAEDLQDEIEDEIDDHT